MAITLADFTKIWASTSPLTPYSFSDANYQEGWNFVGSTPPARQMWDFIQKNNDEKLKYIVDNFLPTAGGTMTGTITSTGYPAIKSPTNDDQITLVGGGGTGSGDGAKFILNGGTRVSNAGDFTLQAGNGNGYKALIGKPSGEFTWGGSNVAVTGTLQNGHGILTGFLGDISVSANSYASGTINFGQTFASTPIVVVCCSYGHAHVHAGCSNITTTSFNYMVSNEGSGNFSNEKINWVAIG